MMTTFDIDTLTGRFFVTLHDTSCEIELWQDATGCIRGVFAVDDERLEIMGGLPNAFGECFGLIREPGGDTLAIFRAAPHAQDLMFEVDLPDENELMKLANAEQIVFRRVT